MQYRARVLILSLTVILSGCGALPNRIVLFGPVSGCSGVSEESLLASRNSLGATTSTDELHCAMRIARNATMPSFVKSSLSSEIALHLAERQAPGADREALAAEGVKLAERSLSAGGKQDAAVHYYLAANLGLAINDHPVQAAENLHRLEDELTLAVKISKAVDQGGPLRLLGMLYLKAPPWPTGVGDGDKALSLLKESVDEFGDHPLNHLFYAEALFEVDEKTAEAQAEIKKGQLLLANGPWGNNREIWQKEFADVINEVAKAPR
ncbi:MAG: hypothetical protein RLZ25_2006 [Pseudomonadota bacterium]|jgi:hypothetical protein